MGPSFQYLIKRQLCFLDPWRIVYIQPNSYRHECMSSNHDLIIPSLYVPRHFWYEDCLFSLGKKSMFSSVTIKMIVLILDLLSIYKWFTREYPINSLLHRGFHQLQSNHQPPKHVHPVQLLQCASLDNPFRILRHTFLKLRHLSK